LHLRPRKGCFGRPADSVFGGGRRVLGPGRMVPGHADMAVWVRKMRTGSKRVLVTASPIPGIKIGRFRTGMHDLTPEMTAVSRNDATPLANQRTANEP
jgi:hypothetical protein